MIKVLLNILTVFALLLTSVAKLEANDKSNSILDLSEIKQSNCKLAEKNRTKSVKNYSIYAACVINNNYNTFLSIYNRHLRKNPNDKGDVSFKITVNNSGKITHLEADKSDIKSKGLIKKLKARLLHIKLLEPKEKNATFVYKFSFSKSKP